MTRRIALVVGGTSGMGAETARLFEHAGMTVTVAARRAANTPPGCEGLQMDVSDENSVRECFEEVERKHGAIAVVANFAGSLGSTPPSRIADMPLDEWEDAYAVNSRGSFLLAREFFRRRIAAPEPDCRLILIASVAAQIGTRVSGAAYASSKGAVLSLVRTAALEMAPFGITVNAISPGSIRTPMLENAMTAEMEKKIAQAVPLGRIGEPMSVAAAALFLASREAAYITGSCIDVNGGLRFN